MDNITTKDMDFTYQQKIAMMRILLDIVNADGIVDVRETFFFNQLMVEFSMKEEDHKVVKEKNSLLALVQINDMNEDQKDYFSDLMTKMIVVDGDVNVNEVAVYNVIFQFCSTKKPFVDQKIPDGLTHSYGTRGREKS